MTTLRRPTLDELEHLIRKHQGNCPNPPCDACALVPEVQALLRLLRFITESVDADKPKETAG